MSKFYGEVGYGITRETAPGVWKDEIETYTYYGDVERPATRWETGSGVNDDLAVRNNISILADPFAYEHFSLIKYVKWMGVKWKVTNVEVQRPRLILTLGGEWNGD